MCKDSKVRNHGTVDELKEAKCFQNTDNKKEKKLRLENEIGKHIVKDFCPYLKSNENTLKNFKLTV